ncbi:MAG: GGDEF domain-containing protein, partial [Gammaproteobacteria bacterium]|nr:GGDEF domain-containing protein [Gammaproteobacteria bacterium]
LVVLDHDYKVHVWNSFMENHSSIAPGKAINSSIFDLFSDIPADWFKRKIDSVFLLNNRAFTIWEQRPYLFKFKNYLPITGIAEFMYQNITLIPLVSADSKVQHVGIMVYDVTDIAINKKQLETANDSLAILSRTDRLTQLYNRGYWEETLIQEYLRNHRSGNHCTLVMFDIDHFKQVNDTYGHQAGDEVIRVTSKLLLECKRATDIAGRYGGEEFTVILVDTDPENALIFAERLRKRIEAITVIHDTQEIKFTISLGLAGLNKNINDHKAWIECSDRALYKAKETGRNRSIVYSPVLNK